MPDPSYRRVPDVMVTDVDGEIVLLDPRTQRMFTLNRTGAVVWEHAEEGPRAISDHLVERFEVSPEAARADVDALISALSDAGLLERS